MFIRPTIAAAAAIGVSLSVAAGPAEAQAKFISVAPGAAPEVRVLGNVDLPQIADLPQVGTEVPDGPKRVRARVSDRTLEAYARASLLALRVFEKYEDRARRATDRHQAQMVASSANSELAAVLDRSGVMDHASFLRMTNALNANDALAHRARQVAERVLR